ncbi:Multidrug resistance protein MdtG [Methanogenium sp. MK-MG]|nr:Multidrug resistance protein MdtG [Methanogenium sp. MK-MG]
MADSAPFFSDQNLHAAKIAYQSVMGEEFFRGPMYILLVAVFLGMLGLGIVIPLLPIFVDNFGASHFWVGALFAGYGLSRIMFTPAIANYSDRHGRKWLISAGLALYTVVSLCYIFAGSVCELFVIRFVHGIASAMIGPIAMAYVGDLTPQGMEGQYQGRLSNVFYLGMGAGPLIGGALYHLSGLSAVFLLMAVLSFIPCLLCIRYLPDSKPEYHKSPSIWKAFLHRRMQASLFYRFINCFPYAAFMVFLPVLAANEDHFSTTVIGLIIAVEVLSMGMSLGYFGRLVDRHKKFWFVVGGTLLLSAGTLVIPFVRNVFVVGLIALCIGVGNAMAISAATAVVAIDGRELGQGVAMGAFNTVVSMGITIPPLIFGVILVSCGVDAIFIISGLLALAALVPFWLLVVRSRKRPAERGVNG